MLVSIKEIRQEIKPKSLISKHRYICHINIYTNDYVELTVFDKLRDNDVYKEVNKKTLVENRNEAGRKYGKLNITFKEQKIEQEYQSERQVKKVLLNDSVKSKTEFNLFVSEVLRYLKQYNYTWIKPEFKRIDGNLNVNLIHVDVEQEICYSRITLVDGWYQYWINDKLHSKLRKLENIFK